jgi:uncharacterized protein
MLNMSRTHNIWKGSTMTEAMPTARELYDRMKLGWISELGVPPELYAEDVVVETPFSPPGNRRRTEGRDEWLAFAGASRAALPVRFEAYREIAVHETTDPGVIVAEYELTATVTTTGERASARFIGVLGVRDGQIVLWREYQDVLTMATALNRRPDALDALPT